MCYLPKGTCPYQDPVTGVCNGTPPIDCYWRLEEDLDSNEDFYNEGYQVSWELCSQNDFDREYKMED